jgi:hypothetical protein
MNCRYCNCKISSGSKLGGCKSCSGKRRKISEFYRESRSIALKGKKKSPEHIKNMSIGMMGIGHPHTEEYKIRMSKLAKKGSNHPNWKGNDAKYLTKHIDIYRKYGKANKCENKKCPRICKQYEWSNISGKYLRKRSDYRMLCISCHRRYDYKRRLNAE